MPSPIVVLDGKSWKITLGKDNYALNIYRKRKSGKYEGEYKRTKIRYFSDLASALNSLLDAISTEKIQTESIVPTDIKTLQDIIINAKEEIKQLILESPNLSRQKED